MIVVYGGNAKNVAMNGKIRLVHELKTLHVQHVLPPDLRKALIIALPQIILL